MRTLAEDADSRLIAAMTARMNQLQGRLLRFIKLTSFAHIASFPTMSPSEQAATMVEMRSYPVGFPPSSNRHFSVLA